MRNFSVQDINSMARKKTANFHYQPFPGKIPIRIMIRISVASPHGGQTSRFCYNGRWTFSAIRRAKKIYNSLDPENRSSWIIEYCQNGILYSGTLESGITHSARSGVVVSPVFDYTGKSERVTNLFKPATPVKVGSEWVLWEGPLSDSNKVAVRNFCQKAIWICRGGWHRGI